MKTEVINANLSRMPKTELLGFPVLLSKERVSRQTVHFDLHIYELRGQLGTSSNLYLVRDAGDFFMGTIISALPLLPEGIDELPLTPTDFKTEEVPDAYLTVSEFEERYGR